ncbi:hypothetical protein A1Q2_00498 [Trichosporon asahii var. asahii CBS 8904]|uniref:J domain-containing protein n=1 Tax=Trichosporon asahii var. asahii (strain CBS 8904) TaxID=1220162 RepID=K1W8X6_TRIAC|nr:hypothetical protein A1Q2_00498 [Trichosporon asahii var. asahii CBS 8904]
MAWLSGGLVEAEPHLVPFWTLIVHINRTWFVKNVEDGTRKLRFKQTQWPTAQMFTIAAVPETHWAHGLVLTPDSFDMAVCSEDPSLERIVRGDNAHLFPHYDPLFAAKFAYGPPKMSRELLQAIADRQPLLYSASQGKTMLADKLREVNILGDTSSFIFPHYRLIYRQTNDPDKEAYFDTGEVQNGGLRPLVRIPGGFGRRSEDDLAGPNRPVHMQWIPAQNTIAIGHCPPAHSAELHELLISSMRSNPIQKIASFPPELTNSTYTPAFLQGKPIADPLFPGIQRRGPSVSEHLRRRAASVSSTASAAGPSNVAGSAGTRPTAKAGPTVTDSREQVETRNRLLRQRLREQVQRQRAWAAVGSDDGRVTPGTPGAPSQVVAAYEEKQYAAGRPQPAVHKIISDPRSYYKRLGMVPEPRHLQYFHEKEVDAEIKEVYRELTLQNHPDRAASPEEEARLHHIMANINVAKDHLETAEKRIVYHNRFSPTKLYR